MGKVEIRNRPVSEMKWVHRLKERKELPEYYFLLQKERKFPYRNPDGSINLRLLRAAIVRAKQHGYEDVARRAKALYEKYKGKEE